jgi:hypothetical protein
VINLLLSVASNREAGCTSELEVRRAIDCKERALIQGEADEHWRTYWEAVFMLSGCCVPCDAVDLRGRKDRKVKVDCFFGISWQPQGWFNVDVD